MSNGYSIRLLCRACNSAELYRQIINLGKQFVVDFPEHDVDRNSLIAAPLSLMLCDNCKLLQLSADVNPDRLYRKFWYRSGISEVMRKALHDIVNMARYVVDLADDDSVLDIGCNDGTMLEMYNNPAITRVGCDPATELVAEAMANGRCEVTCPDYFTAKNVELCAPYKVITAIACFYDMNDPWQFLFDCKQVLHNDGVLILQFNYLKSMLEQNAFDNICHEHVTYFLISTLEPLIEKAGLEIQGVQTNDVNGGSIRFYITHAGRPLPSPKVKPEIRMQLYGRYQALKLEETQMQLDTPMPYTAFSQRMIRICSILQDYLHVCRDKGVATYAYGASTRGTTLLQTAEIGPDLIRGAAERDKHKVGKMMVGSWLPIVSEEEARKTAQQFVMLPWHFREGILVREEPWVKNGGKFLIPLPKPQLYTDEGNVPITANAWSEVAS
jgi:SAM-dependent methyltransferase